MLRQQATKLFAAAMRNEPPGPSARRAMPQAAAPTLARNVSIVSIASLKPSPSFPDHVFSRHATLIESNLADRMRRNQRSAFDDAKARHL